jgi:CheY-like chemotaxis protein
MKTKKILVIEDDRVSQKALADVFRASGYEVVVATDAPEALRLARTENPDLITLDLDLSLESLPEWDGFTVAAWLKQLHSGKPMTPIVVISATEPERGMSKLQGIGIAAYLRKPVKKQGLLDLLQRTLGGPSAEKPA